MMLGSECGARLGARLGEPRWLKSATCALLVLGAALVLGASCARGQDAAATFPGPHWHSGAEAVFALPRFTDDVALTRADEDLSGNSLIEALPFDYDFTPSQRIWMEYQSARDVGIRTSWWQLDSRADRVQSHPPASGFGELTHPALFGVDLSSVVPAETLTADSSFDLMTIDLEVTKRAVLAEWDLLFSAGLRHAAIDRTDDWTLVNSAGDMAGQARLDQDLRGLGPTLGIATTRWAFDRLMLSAGMRASVLLAESERTLRASEDLDLPTPFTTGYRERLDDLLPIVETRFAGQWAALDCRHGSLTLNAGVEAQWWSGVGTANNRDSDLALLGLSVGAGWMW